MRTLACLLGIFLLTSCATIVSESNWPVTIDGSSPGAILTVTKEGGGVVASGAAPRQVMLDSGDGYYGRAHYRIDVRTATGGSSTSTLTSHFNGWHIGNLLFGGLIGFLIVDPLTGAMYRFDERFVVNVPTAP